MYKFVTRACIFSILFFANIAVAQTDNSNGESLLKIKLSADWKITKTQTQAGGSTITEYTKNPTHKKEVLIQTSLRKFNNDKVASLFGKKLYEATRQLVLKSHCELENLKPTSNNSLVYGALWQCAYNNSTGWMIFIDTDPNMLHTLNYKATESYPLTKTKRVAMLNLLKSFGVSL
jgi:hypothetical protein